MKTVSFEKRNKEVASVKTTIEYIAKTAQTKQDAVNRLADVLPNNLKVGYGGSHVWCCGEDNVRLFIITGY